MSQTNEVEVRKEQSNDEVLQWVTFQLEEETYGINVMQVREVLRYTELLQFQALQIMCSVLLIFVVMS